MKTKRVLKRWVKATLAVIFFLASFTLCMYLLYLVDLKQKENAYEEGRYEVHYTQLGDRYYE